MRNRTWLGSLGFVCAWLGLLGLATALRAYHLPGFVVNNDEGHWLIYALDKRLLFEPVRNSYPRPDILFPFLVTIPIQIFGPNELALRLWPALLGSLSLLPLGRVVWEITRSRKAALFAGAFLAVLPLHVYFSAQGVPDTVALFFGLGALVFLLQARTGSAVANLIAMGICLTLALLTKATALYLWGFVAVAGVFLIDDRRRRPVFCGVLVLAALPLALVTFIISQHSPTLSFFREPGITETFGFSLARFALHLRYLIAFYGVLSLLALIGAGIAIVRAARGSAVDRKCLLWLLPLVNLAITPFFRAGRVELLWLIPTFCLFAVLALESWKKPVAWSAAGIVVAILLARSLFGVPLPYPGRAKPATDYTTAVLDRPAGWPSRDAARWLVAHTSTDDAIIITAYTFTDPLLLDLNRFRRVLPNGGENWPLLRDPANRVKYVVFTQDYRAYASSLAQYADAHFTLPADAQFPNYAIYDCQKDGRFVAYADASGSGSRYLQEGMEFLQRHELEQAVECFQKELTVNPDQPTANVNLALLDYQLGRVVEGIAQCEHNIRAGIAPAVSYGVLGQLRETQGDIDGARAAYEKSLAIDPQNRVTKQLLANLKVRVPSSVAPPQ